MHHPSFIEGGRVSLRPVEEADLPFLTAGVNHPEVRARVGQPFPTSLARERQYLEASLERSDALQLLITAPGADDADADEPADDVDAPATDGRRLGVVELDPIDTDTGVADIAIWVHPDRQRGGYAREAVELAIDYVFAERRIHKVTASAYAPNTASRRLIESLGFVEEGVGREDAFIDGAYRDTHYYGLLDREWAERRADAATTE